MAQGRGSALALVSSALLLCLLAGSEIAEAAATYVVGDSRGWTFDTAGWPAGKSFKAGDVLVFNYNPTAHNVVAVTAAGYGGCAVPSGSKVYTSGKDSIVLGPGTSYFICSFAGHCEAGMKIAVTAA